MGKYEMAMVYAVLILLLVWLIAYLKERANDDDQRPQ